MSTESTEIVAEIPTPTDTELDSLESGADTTQPEAEDMAAGKKTYWFQIWKRCASYRVPQKGAKPIGFLPQGNNYFYGQRRFPGVVAKDTDDPKRPGKYQSDWWALTDDNSGNTDVWVSCIYFKGGENFKPVKGLPTI